MRNIFLLLLVLSVFHIDCSESLVPGIDGSACGRDEDCLEGLICYQAQICRQGCKTNNDCDIVKQHCEKNVCLPGSGMICGNSNVEGTETCDDGAFVSGDGCSSTCAVELGYECLGEPSVCSLLCGNGKIDNVNEDCDDGDTDSNDGCSSTCVIEDGYSCTPTQPSVCTLLCGNGSLDSGEQCDDGNPNANDGCSPECKRDTGYECTGQPSKCAPKCGDGFVIKPDEECDDFDLLDNGCLSDCTIGLNWKCSGEPSVCECIRGFQDNDGDGICNIDCDSDPCVQGICEDTGGITSCNCSPYFYGEICDTCRVFADASSPSASPNGQNWSTAYLDLQGAISQADSIITTNNLDGCEIWVARGIYRPGNAAADTFNLPTGIKIYGCFNSGMTSLEERDCVTNVTRFEGENATNNFHIITTNGKALIDGITLQNAEAVSGTSGLNQFGGAILAANNEELIIRNTIIQDNQALKLGGGIYAVGGTVELTNVKLTNNIASTGTPGFGGGAYISNAAITLNDVVFSSNAAKYGGGLYIDNVTGSITNAIITHNEATQDGGGLYINYMSPISLTAAHIFDNQADNIGSAMAVYNATPSILNSYINSNHSGNHGAMAFIEQSHAQIKNSLIVYNTSDQASTLYVEYSHPVFTNCTIAYNSSANDVSIVANGGAQPEFINTLLWENDETLMQCQYTNTVPIFEYTFYDGEFSSCASINYVDGNSFISQSFEVFQNYTNMWTDIEYNSSNHTTRLSDSTASWAVDGLINNVITHSTGQQLWSAVIIDNSATDLIFYGDYNELDMDSSSDTLNTYEISSIKLADDSIGIDAGKDIINLTTDISGKERVPSLPTADRLGSGPNIYPDLGAIEK